MPLTRSFPIDQGFPTALDLRRLDAGLIVREGILADPITVAPAGIAFGAGGFNVSAQPFVAALKRGGAPYSLGYGVARLANDAAGAAWTIPAAPVSNSRIDLLWIRATDPAEGEATSGTDGPGGAPRAVPIFGVTSGTAAPSPVAPALPAGAYLIATVTTPSGAASIAGSTIVQSYGFAQLSGGTIYARTLALLPSTAVEGDRAVALGSGVRYERAGGAWLPEGAVLAVADFTALAALPTGGRVVGDLAHVAEGAVYMSWTGTAWRQVTTATFASTGARDTAYAKASAAYRVAGVRALDTSTAVESQRGASAWVLDDTGYTNATLSAGWTNFAPSPVGFRKIRDIVYIRGRASSTGANATAFTLPIGFRTDTQKIIFLEAGGAQTRYAVNTNGDVAQVSASSQNNASFDNIPPYPAA